MRQQRLDLVDPDDLVVVLGSGSVTEQGRRQELLAGDGAFSGLWARFVEGGESLDELRTVPALAPLSAELLRTLADRLVTERFEAGEVPGTEVRAACEAMSFGGTITRSPITPAVMPGVA